MAKLLSVQLHKINEFKYKVLN